MATIQAINPANGEVFAEYQHISDAEATQAVARADAAYRSWRTVSLDERRALLNRIADVYESNLEELAQTITREMGKPINSARGEIKTCIGIWRYYAGEEAAAYLADEQINVQGTGSAYIRKDPIGVLFGVMPWNFPHYQVVRFAAPNLLLGNTILLKHASNCLPSAELIEKMILEAGAPEGLYQNLIATHGQVAEIIGDARVQGISLTGSEAAGERIGEQAGRNLKKVVLELGGSDPFIVLDDADVQRAATEGVGGRCRNAGQTCTSSKRFIVLDSVYDEFLEKFVVEMQAVTIGDPADESNVIGPLSSEQAVLDIESQVADAVANGAEVLAGGQRLDRPGFYYPATVLTGVTPAARAYREELFAPVAVVYRVADEAEAIALANDSDFGLSSSIYTTDPERADRIAAQLEAGMVWVNSTSLSSAELPFGGVKRSGTGRELGLIGLDEFANRKMVRHPDA